MLNASHELQKKEQSIAFNRCDFGCSGYTITYAYWKSTTICQFIWMFWHIQTAHNHFDICSHILPQSIPSLFIYSGTKGVKSTRFSNQLSGHIMSAIRRAQVSLSSMLCSSVSELIASECVAYIQSEVMQPAITWFLVSQQWGTFARTWHLYDCAWQNPFQSALIIKKHLQGLHKPIYHPLSKYNTLTYLYQCERLSHSMVYTFIVYRRLRGPCCVHKHGRHCIARWRMDKTCVFPSHYIRRRCHLDIGMGIARKG